MIEIFDLRKPVHRQMYNEALWSISYKRPYDSLDFYYNFSNGFDSLICICYKEFENTFLLPGYLRPIPGTNALMDFISPYGYSGPIISNKVDDSFIKNAWRETEKYFKSVNTVSCFLRLALDSQVSGFPGEIYPTMKNIKGEILNEERQWLEFDHKVRKNVNKALREGLESKIIFGSELSENDLSNFFDIYKNTMARNNAQNNFFYSIEAFKNFAAESGDICLFSFIYDKKKAISVEMALISDDSIFSFLGGTLSESFEKRPNDLLKFELINWARNNKIKYFVLGGGYGTEDGIFRYKKAFFPKDVVDYYTGRWIISQQFYDNISKDTKIEYIANNDFSEEFELKDFFPSYRKYM